MVRTQLGVCKRSLPPGLPLAFLLLDFASLPMEVRSLLHTMMARLCSLDPRPSKLESQIEVSAHAYGRTGTCKHTDWQTRGRGGEMSVVRAVLTSRREISHMQQSGRGQEESWSNQSLVYTQYLRAEVVRNSKVGAWCAACMPTGDA